MRNTIISVAVLVVAIFVGWYVLHTYKTGPAEPAAQQPVATALYTCDGGKTIQASYYDGPTTPPATVDQPPMPGGHMGLVLNDGTSMLLAQTISADGTRYANSDESFVFWSKGTGAMVLQNGEEKDYTNCVAQ